MPSCPARFAPLRAMPIRQRDDLAAWLRARGMVSYDSHQVARDPGRRWWIIRGTDGWVRARAYQPAGRSPLGWMSRRLGRGGVAIVEAYVMRFKKLPVGE